MAGNVQLSGSNQRVLLNSCTRSQSTAFGLVVVAKAGTDLELPNSLKAT